MDDRYEPDYNKYVTWPVRVMGRDVNGNLIQMEYWESPQQPDYQNHIYPGPKWEMMSPPQAVKRKQKPKPPEVDPNSYYPE